MTNEEAIEKIKKLLRMKRGGTPGEIENALAMAAKIARQHDVDLDSINPDEGPAKIITHETDMMKLRIPLEARHAANILVNFFNVQICIQDSFAARGFVPLKAKITFVGTGWDIQVARYVFIFLQRHFRYSWNHRENKRLKNREAFLYGMFLGLSHKLDDERETPSEQALIIVDRKKDYLTRLFPRAKDQNIKPDLSGANASKLAGIIAGRETEIRSGLDKAAPQRAALPPVPGQIALL